MLKMLIAGLAAALAAAAGEVPAGGPYELLLKKVVADGSVAWDRFGPEEKALLARALEALAGAKPDALRSKKDRLAFWINAHNACVLNIILEKMPVEDVMTIPGFRDRIFCRVAGEDRSLTEIESGVIRPVFREPRVHFALWWGVKGGPRLRGAPYAGEGLEAQLDEQVRTTVRDDSFLRLDAATSKVVLSPLLEWYRHDFGTGGEGVLPFLKRYLPPEKAKLLPRKLALVSFGPFDWSLDSAVR